MATSAASLPQRETARYHFAAITSTDPRSMFLALDVRTAALPDANGT
jgi:hypothetical protein